MSVIAGAVIGRALPALIVAGLLGAVLLAAGENFYQSVLLRQEAVPVAMTEYRYQGNQPLYFDARWQLRRTARSSATSTSATRGPRTTRTPASRSTREFQLLVPGTEYRWVEAREAAALVGASVVAILIAGVIVQRRRPG